MKALLAIACGTFVLATSAMAQTSNTASTATGANARANAANAAQVGAQMTTCDNQAKANAAANPGMPVSGSASARSGADGCKPVQNNGSAVKTTTGR